MELKLLTPPTDAPSRIQLTRGLPTERSFAVDTSALPRSLPLTLMDPSVASGPMEALARLGVAGTQVSGQALNIVLEAQARKQEADDVAEASGLYTQMALGFDQKVETLKVSTNHRSLRPSFDTAWTESAAASLAGASNDRVRDRLALKLAGYHVTKSAEISDVTRQKFVDYHMATLDTDVDALQKQATDATTIPERDRYLRDLEVRFLEAAHTGIFKASDLTTLREKTLSNIRVDRAQNEAFLAPISMLERISRGEMDDLSTKQKRNLAEYAESRVRTLRSDQDNADAKARRVVKEQQDDLAITWRTRIAENYKVGAPGGDLTMALNTAARSLGETNHKELLEMDRLYRERALKPGAIIKSDKGTVGAITAAYRTGRVNDYTDADLLRLLNNDTLDEGDHRYLSGLRAQILAQNKAEAKSGQTDAEHQRKEQIKDAEKTIDEYLKRGSRFLGDPRAQQTDILVQDAINELHQRLAADPTARPDEVATEMIVGRIDRAEKIAPALPYKTKGDVTAAYQAGLLSKGTATRYYRILEALAPPKGNLTKDDTITPSLGLLDKFKNFLSPPESPVRAPVKP